MPAAGARPSNLAGMDDQHGTAAGEHDPDLHPDLAPLAYRIRKQLVSRLPVSLMTAMARIKERLTRGIA